MVKAARCGFSAKLCEGCSEVTQSVKEPAALPAEPVEPREQAIYPASIPEEPAGESAAATAAGEPKDAIERSSPYVHCLGDLFPVLRRSRNLLLCLVQQKLRRHPPRTDSKGILIFDDLQIAFAQEPPAAPAPSTNEAVKEAVSAKSSRDVECTGASCTGRCRIGCAG